MVFERLAWLNLNHQVVFIQRSAFQYPIRPYPGLSGHFFFVLERRWEGDTGETHLPIWRTRSVTPMQLDLRVRYRPKYAMTWEQHRSCNGWTISQYRTYRQLHASASTLAPELVT